MTAIQSELPVWSAASIRGSTTSEQDIQARENTSDRIRPPGCLRRGPGALVSCPCSSRCVCPSPASCLVLSLRRHSSNASDVQVLALRGPGSSSSLVALFSDRGFYACQFGTSASGSIHHISFSLCFFVQAAFGLRTPCLAVLLIGLLWVGHGCDGEHRAHLYSLDQ